MNILSKIDLYLENREHERSENHYPSEASKCLRAIWYSRKKVPKSNPMDASAIWKTEMGNAIHDRIAKFLADMGINARDEIPFKKNIEGLKFPVSGRIDNVFNEIGEDVGIEIKTTFGRGVVEIQKKRQPKWDAILQVALYLYLTDLNKFYLIYIGRDNGYRCQFEFTMKKDAIFMDGKKLDITLDDIVSKFKRVEKAVDSNDIPDREYKIAIKHGRIRPDGFSKNKVKYKGSWRCSYCGYRDHCWRSELEKYQNSDNSEELENYNG